jgi:hypothetical protein
MMLLYQLDSTIQSRTTHKEQGSHVVLVGSEEKTVNRKHSICFTNKIKGDDSSALCCANRRYVITVEKEGRVDKMTIKMIGMKQHTKPSHKFECFSERFL